MVIRIGARRVTVVALALAAVVLTTVSNAAVQIVESTWPTQART